jgi:predicted PurR-regulated permease PerM
MLDWLQHVALPWAQSRWAWPMASGSSTRSRPRSAHMGQTTDIVGVAVPGHGFEPGLIGWLANLVLIPVVGFYLLRDWDLMMAKMRSLLPRQREAQWCRWPEMP